MKSTSPKRYQHQQAGITRKQFRFYLPYYASIFQQHISFPKQAPESTFKRKRIKRRKRKNRAASSNSQLKSKEYSILTDIPAHPPIIRTSMKLVISTKPPTVNNTVIHTNNTEVKQALPSITLEKCTPVSTQDNKSKRIVFRRNSITASHHKAAPILKDRRVKFDGVANQVSPKFGSIKEEHDHMMRIAKQVYP